MRLLLFLDAVYCDSGFGVDAHSVCHRGLCEYATIISFYITHPLRGTDRLLDCFGRWRGEDHPHHLTRHDWCNLWSSSSRVHPSTQMGHGQMDDVLHSRYPHLLLYAPDLLLLVRGRLLVGCNACCPGRVRKEDYCSCMWALFNELMNRS